MTISGGGEDLFIFTVKSTSGFDTFLQLITFGIGTFARSFNTSIFSRNTF
jgi:hypothetical protein